MDHSQYKMQKIQSIRINELHLTNGVCIESLNTIQLFVVHLFESGGGGRWKRVYTAHETKNVRAVERQKAEARNISITVSLRGL